jgi:hypothetical protein
MDQNSKIRVPGITAPPVRLQHTSIEELPGGVSVMKLNINTPVPNREITSELLKNWVMLQISAVGSI